MRLKAVTPEDIPFGRVLPFALLDADANILIAAGQSVTPEQFAVLETFGVFRDADWEPPLETTEHGTIGAGLPAPHPITPYDGRTPQRQSDTRANKQPPKQSDGIQYLRMNFLGSEEGFFVRLYGMVPGQSLIISAPIENGQLLFVKEGDLFDFKGFYSRAIYSFSAAVRQVCFQPFPYLHINWPEPSRVSKQIVRQTRRIDISLPCTLYIGPALKKTINGVVRNLSTGGLEIELFGHLDDTTPAGSQVKVAFRVPVHGQKFMIEHEAKLVGKRTYEDEPAERYGLSFENLPYDMLLALHGYIQETLLNRLETPLFAV
ncbi:flagellar brake protein [Parvibium lacunae]|uniref:Flagellar brake protein n=1 Tax=Parvibium lacunae TaxID=1888893 RepID=A0A368L1K3_9BURK|nr:flagellar brake protein [Parvibium lacunae]RCS57447.1 flagellar brake protein [Parvibium lacunae]